MNQYIIEIDSSASFSDMPDEQKAVISKLKVQWPETQMIGTTDHNDKRLILVLANCDLETLNNAMNGEVKATDENGEEVTHNFNLGWNIVASEGESIDQSLILPYMLPELKVSEDEAGEVITESIPITDLTGKLQTYAGKKWLY